jgi:tetratricopeptide (TPR) repeat protein
VVSTIEPKVQESEIRRAQGKVTKNLTAYDLYMRAVALLYEFNEEASDKALALLERAIGLDNRYSSAHGAICWCMIDRNQQRWGNLDETRARGLQAARLAVEFGKDDASALGLAGLAMGVLGGGTDAGLAQCERAVALNPNSSVALGTAGSLHNVAGNYDKALKYVQASIRLNPIDPNGFRTFSMAGWAHLHTGEPEIALGWADKALSEQPSFRTALLLKMTALALLGRTDEAVASASRLMALNPTTIAAFRANPFFPRDERRHAVEKVLRQAGAPE